MKQLVTTILIILSCSVVFYGQDLPFIDGSFSSRQKADRYFSQMAYPEALKYYAQALAKSPDNEDIKLNIAKCYTQLRDLRNALPYYQASITSANAAPQDVLNYADALTASGDYEQARKWYEVYRAQTPHENMTLQKLERLDHRESLYEDSLAYYVTLSDFNSQQADFSPTYFNNQILFVSNRATTGFFQFTDGRNGAGFLDIYKYDNGHVSRFEGLRKGLHEGPISFFENGKKLLLTTSQRESLGKKDQSISSTLKLVIYEQTGGAWQYAGDFPYNNRNYSVAHPAFDQINNVLYFVSNMPGGKGGSDLYSSEYQNGNWSEPKNLELINTLGDELFPFISNDGDLYFASNGRGGLGGLDLFKTNRADAKNAVYNLGYPVNTPDDDFGLALDETGRKGYVSSNRKNGVGNDDVYALTIFKTRVEARFTDDLTGSSVATQKVEIVDQLTGQEVTYSTDGETIKFDAMRGRKYQLLVESDGYGKHVVDFCTKTDESVIVLDLPMSKPLAKETGKKTSIAFVRCSNLSKVVTYQIASDEVLQQFNETELADRDTILEIGNAYFKFDSDQIRSGESELIKVSALLNKFQMINVQVVVYCDGFGSLTYNDALAKERVDQVIAYLNKHGIARGRINTLTVGSRQFLSKCQNPSDCRVEENQRNRRVEFFLLPGAVK